MTIDFNNFAEDVLEQAAAWVARFRSDQHCDSDQQDFALWLAESGQHQAAFDEMLLLWESMAISVSDNEGQSPNQTSYQSGINIGNNLLEEPQQNTKEHSNNRAYLGKIAGSAFHNASNDSEDSPTFKHPRSQSNKPAGKNWWRIGTFSVAASLLALAFSVFFLTSKPSEDSAMEFAQELYATPIGKQQRFVLSDGSILQLNTGTQVTVRFSETERQLNLLQGEAYFEVSPDANRPFIVDAGLGEITAIGTAFDIHRSDDSVVIAVTHGVVAISDTREPNLLESPFDKLSDEQTRHQDRAQKTTKLSIGKQITVSADSGISLVENADLEKITAWRADTLIFRDASLVDALADLNRYLAQAIDLSDPSLKTLRISGTFNISDPNSTFAAIVASFQLESYNSPITNKTRLYRRAL